MADYALYQYLWDALVRRVTFVFSPQLKAVRHLLAHLDTKLWARFKIFERKD
jgi:hypothetical protein